MSIAELPALALAHVQAVLASPRELVAWLAGALAASFVIGSAFVRTMIPLRWLAVGGNVGFIVFGALHGQHLTLFVAAVLLPINAWRARQMMRLARRVRSVDGGGDLVALWLRPYMKSRRLKAGTVLFRKGDAADHLYCLVEGRIELVETGMQLEPGEIFGEIAFFAPERQRTLTARCVGACTVLMIDGITLQQLYHQNPGFGKQLVELVASRLLQDVRRTEQRLADLRDRMPPPQV